MLHPLVPTREELKALIDCLPDEKLGQVRQMLEFHLHPPEVPPEMKWMEQRSTEYREKVFQRFQVSRRPGTPGAGGGTGFAGMHEGTPFSRHGFHYWDEKALVHQSLQSFDCLDLEVMERLSFSPDQETLVCALEISSGGHTVRHQDEFPCQRQRRNNDLSA